MVGASGVKSNVGEFVTLYRHCEVRSTCEASLNTIENNKQVMKNLTTMGG